MSWIKKSSRHPFSAGVAILLSHQLGYFVFAKIIHLPVFLSLCAADTVEQPRRYLCVMSMVLNSLQSLDD